MRVAALSPHFVSVEAGRVARHRFALTIVQFAVYWSFDMRYFVWILRLVIFVVILMFALKNTRPVDVSFFADHVIVGVPLIVVMLVMLVLGTVLGWLIAMPSILKHRREVARLKRDKVQLEEKLDRVMAPPVEAAAPATVAPLAPL